MSETLKDEPKPVDTATESTDKPEETQPENSVNVSTALSASSWNVRIRKVLLSHDTAILGALGQAMLTLVEVVETLKREKVATVKSIETCQVPVQAANRTVTKAKLIIKLERGENAMLLSGYRLRRVLALFDHLHEKHATAEGKSADPFDYAAPEYLPLDVVKKIDFDLEFDDAAKSSAAGFLGDVSKSKSQLSAQEFVKYVSYLVTPSLANKAFDAAFAALVPPKPTPAAKAAKPAAVEAQ